MKDESKDEFFLQASKVIQKESQTPNFVERREGLVMWESYVNCGRTQCPGIIRAFSNSDLPEHLQVQVTADTVKSRNCDLDFVNFFSWCLWRTPTYSTNRNSP